MDFEITGRWEDYYQSVKALHMRTDYGLVLVDVEALEFAVLEQVVVNSGALTNAFEEIVPGEEGEEAEELETAILAAASIDLAVAAELLTELRWTAEDALEGGVTVPAAVEEGVPDREELDPIATLLRRANDAFPQGEVMPMSGGALGSNRPEARADEAIDDLVATAAPVSTAFGVALIAAATADVVGVAHELLTPGTALEDPLSRFDGIGGIAEKVGPTNFRFGHALRLVASGVRKLTVIVGGDCIRDAGVHLKLEQIVDALDSRLRVGERIVRRAAGADGCERKVRESLRDRQADMSKLDPDLSELCRRYAKNMRWARVAARRIRMCAPVLILLGAGIPGSVVVISANAIGLIYSLYSLADRLDSMPGLADRVPGVLRIVEAA
jgi:hypothetical protein